MDQHRYGLMCMDVTWIFVSLILGVKCELHGLGYEYGESTLVISLYTAAIMIVISEFLDVYQPDSWNSLGQLIGGTTLSSVIVFIVSGVTCLCSNTFLAPKRVLAFWFLCSWLMRLIALCTVWRMLVYKRRNQSILVVGGSEHEVKSLVTQIRADHKSHSAIIREVIASYNCEWDIQIKGVSTIVVGAQVNKGVFRQIKDFALHEGKRVHLVPVSQDLLLMRMTTDTIGDILTFSYHPLGIPKSFQIAKRLVDIVASLSLLAIFSVPMLILYLIIPIFSEGPSLYRQIRVGLNGRNFEVYKFRSMVVNAEKGTGAVFAQTNDSRVTRLGLVMRSTRLDELPQLFNVLKGDMSIVGPRPERPEFVGTFENLIPDYSQRHLVRPGLTGVAQVMANYATNAEDKLRHDLWYIRNYNPILDFKILMQTVLVVLTPSKAKGVENAVNNTTTFALSNTNVEEVGYKMPVQGHRGKNF